MLWNETSPGHWASEAGSVDANDGELQCLANGIGSVQVAKGSVIEEAKRAVEAAHAQQGVVAHSTSSRRGRKPKGARPMTAAERQAARMERMRRKVADAASAVQQLGEMPLDPLTKADLNEIWNWRRIEIRQWLETQAPPLAPVYEEIVTLMHMPESPARLHFVAHGIREIGNRLPEYLDKISSEKVLYEALVRPISGLWEQAGLPIGDRPFPTLIDAPQIPGENQVKIPMELARRIAKLLGEHAEGEVRSKKRSAVLFGALKKKAGIATGGAQLAVKRWDAIREWAVKNAHVSRQGPECTYAELQERFAEFERILYALIGRFVGVLGEVDEILTAAPSAGNIDAAIALLSRGGARNYFFERVSDPNWLRVLDEKGYFDALLEGEHWPESAFLTRMAGCDPERVTQILERLTKNPETLLRFYLTDIVTALPPSHAARLVGTIAEIAGEGVRPFSLWYNLPKLIVHLANGGQGNAAFRLFDAMYSARRMKADDGSEEISFPNTSNDLWLLQEGLKSIQPALLQVDAKMLIEALCAKLKDAVIAEGLLRSDADHSFVLGGRIAMPAADESPSDFTHDAASMFARAIVVTSKMAIRSGMIGVDEAMDLIEHRRAKSNRPKSERAMIFKFVSFTLLASVGPEAAEKAVAVMTNPAEYEDSFFQDSFGQLLQARFSELSDEQRESVLGWIRKGPDLEKVMPRWEAARGAKPTAEEWEIFRKGWTRTWLNWIPTEFLAAADMEMLKRIEAELDPELRNWSMFGVDTTPKTLEKLQAMSPEEVAEFLKLNPPDRGRGPVSELATLLPQVVQERAAEFSGSARAFVGVHQSWVRSLLWGLDSSVKQGMVIDWEPLLALFGWVVEQPRGQEPRDVVGNGDVSWEGTRGAMADLIRTGLQNTKASMPVTLGPVVWAILKQLAEDTDPTIEYEQDRAFESAMLSINSVRGKAMHAVIQYALWRRRRMTEEGITGGLETMPEVRALLDDHLDLERDPSPAIRSVYAQYFPALVYLDAEWAAAVAPNVFPAAAEHMRYWRASWSVYATFAQTFDQVFDILRPTYELAVQRMPWNELADSPRGPDGEDWRSAEKKVACHLLAFYWRGKIEMEDDGLLFRFFARCTPSSRSSALRFVANSLASHEGDLSADLQERLTTLWEWRMKEAGESNDPKEREELTTFGGWFAYGKLDPEWSSRMLIEVLKLAEKVGHPGMVIGRIAVIAQTDLKRAVDCLQAFVAADREGWRHTMAKDDLETILRAALHSDQPEITRPARGIIDKLAERGDLSYRALVTPPREDTI